MFDTAGTSPGRLTGQAVVSTLCCFNSETFVHCRYEPWPIDRSGCCFNSETFVHCRYEPWPIDRSGCCFNSVTFVHCRYEPWPIDRLLEEEQDDWHSGHAMFII